MFELIKPFMLLLAHRHSYRLISPSLLSWLAVVSIITDGEMGEGEIKREAERERRFISCLLLLLSSATHCSPSIMYTCSIHLFICHPAARTFFFLVHPIYHNLLPSIYLSGLSQKSRQQPFILLIHLFVSPSLKPDPTVSWPLTHPLTSEIWPFSNPSFSFQPLIYPHFARSTFCQQVKACLLHLSKSLQV